MGKTAMIESENDQVLRILRNLGPIKLDEFDDRLRLQKQAYLIQEIGATTKYTYSWYVHGPYSSSLTSALFLGDKIGKFDSKDKLRDGESRIVSRLKELLGRRISDPRQLELFASVWYLLPTSRRVSKDDREGIMTVMNREKPQFTSTRVRSALDTILGFKKTQKA